MESATNIGLIVIGLSALVSLAAGLMNIFGRSQRRDISPNPLVVTAKETFVDEKRFQEHVRANDMRATQLADELRAITARMEQTTRDAISSQRLVHRRLNVISENVATIAGAIAHSNGQPIHLVREGAEG